MTDILIIEDDLEIAKLMCRFLNNDGYTCEIRASGESGLEYLSEHSVRLVLLDIMLPGMDGFAVCAQIHQQLNIPLIIISACNGKDSKIAGLKCGADDYVEKPFDVDVLRAKIGALFRRHYGGPSADKRLIAGELDINVDARTVCLSGKPLELSQTEFDLLCYLVEHKGKVLSKATLFDAVWGTGCYAEVRSLNVYIFRLRDKIEHDSKRPKHIITVRGVGFRYDE
ncbi:MAG: response regulator transcription factor [Peptococcaceae bacterium]|nr:response regulator transcription factor [Peptococcaceae bacterium]